MALSGKCGDCNSIYRQGAINVAIADQSLSPCPYRAGLLLNESQILAFVWGGVGSGTK